MKILIRPTIMNVSTPAILFALASTGVSSRLMALAGVVMVLLTSMVWWSEIEREREAR